MSCYEIWGMSPGGPLECYCVTGSLNHANWLAGQLTTAQWVGVEIRPARWGRFPPWLLADEKER